MNSNPTRRRFLATSLAAGASLAVGRMAAAARPEGGEKKTLLVLGGTGFTGPFIVETARARGYAVSIFTRGKTNPDLEFPADVERIRGNRDPKIEPGLEALKGRKFDMVIDTSGHVPRHMKASCEILAPNIGHYVYVSSLSAYASHDTPGADESAPLEVLTQETEDYTGDAFGPLKVLCEKAVTEALPGRSAVVRPGLIVGPRDWSDRFTYWVARVDRGGEVLAPGKPDERVMIIDGRDLADFLVHLASRKTSGVFNAIGPDADRKLTMLAILESAKRASGSDARFTWVSQEFLEANDMRPWSVIPLWAPSNGPLAGFHHRSIAAAVKAGITFRPIDVTVKDTLEFYRAWPEERRQNLRRGLKPERESELLAKWHAAND